VCVCCGARRTGRVHLPGALGKCAFACGPYLRVGQAVFACGPFLSARVCWPFLHVGQERCVSEMEVRHVLVVPVNVDDKADDQPVDRSDVPRVVI
jgi:hypothetical protein